MAIVFRGTRAELRRALAEVPAILAGTAPDPHGLAANVRGHVGNALLDQIQQAFKAKSVGGTGSDGITWPPLAPATLKQKQRAGSPPDTLVATGDLYRSLTPGSEGQPSGAPGQIFRVDARRVIVGTTVKTWHHKGTRRRPARPLWPLSGRVPTAWRLATRAAAKRGVAAAVAEYLRGARS